MAVPLTRLALFSLLLATPSLLAAQATPTTPTVQTVPTVATAPTQLAACDTAAMRLAKDPSYRPSMVVPDYHTLPGTRWTVSYLILQTGMIDTSSVTVDGVITPQERQGLLKNLSKWRERPAPCVAPIRKTITISTPGKPRQR